MYDDGSISEEAAHALDRSLGPRGPEMLFDLVRDLGIGPAHLALDVGCREMFATPWLAEIRIRPGSP